jgi:hypothetical protein
MEPTELPCISVIEPIGAAIEKTKEVLFRPFDITKWFAIGFCAFLATLGNGGAPNIGGGGAGQGSGGCPQDFQQEMNNLKDAVLDNLPIIISVASLIVLLIVVISILFMWLKSRGQFMFLHCVVQNKGEVVKPWKQYLREANSLFLFKLLLGLAGFVGTALFIVPLAVIGISFAKTGIAGFAVANLLWFFLLIFCIIIWVMALAGVKLLTDDFVIPIMSLRHCTVTDGWKEFWGLLMANKGPFTIYLLFLFVIGLCIGAIVVLAVFATCCCAGCLLLIPYIGTLVMLPILVWRRAYSLFYLSQYGSQFDVFGRQSPPIVVPTESIPPIEPL